MKFMSLLLPFFVVGLMAQDRIVVNPFGAGSPLEFIPTPSSGPGSGTVTSVATSCGVTGGTITATGTISETVATAAHNGSYAILTGDCGKSLTTNTTAAWTIAACGSSGFSTGNFWTLNNVGSGALTLTATTSTFYGGPTANISGSVLTVPADSSAQIACDGTNYQVLGSGGGGGSGSPAFSTITSGTNTAAAMVVGSGATLGATGSGSITATAMAVGGITGLGTGVGTWLATPSGANLSSALTSSLPNTKGGTGGDSSAGTGIAHVSSGTWSYSALALTDMATQSANTVLGNYTTGSAVPTAGAAPSGGTSGCSGTTDAVTYTTNTGWGCHQISGGSSATTFQSSAVTTNIGATNILASAATTNNGYLLRWTISLTTVGTGCTGSTVVTLNAIFTDPNGSGSQTEVLGTITLAANGNGTAGFVAGHADNIWAKSGTAIQYSTSGYTAGAGCSVNPTYQVTGALI
jgi:hypothetical protein